MSSEQLLRQRHNRGGNARSTTGKAIFSSAAERRRSDLKALTASARAGWGRAFTLTFSTLNPRSKRPGAVAYRWAIALLTGIALVCWLLESEPAVQQRAALRSAFDATDGLVSSVFLVDYCLRLWIAPGMRRFRLHSPLVARLMWVISWDALLLAAATFPFFVDMLDGRSTFESFSWLRIFRVFFLFRSSRFSQSISMVVRVCFVNRVVLFSSLTFIFFMILITVRIQPPLASAPCARLTSMLTCDHLSAKTGGTPAWSERRRHARDE
jgi:hypothetical protein